MPFQPRQTDLASTSDHMDRREQQPVVVPVDFAQDLARLGRLAQSDYLA